MSVSQSTVLLLATMVVFAAACGGGDDSGDAGLDGGTIVPIGIETVAPATARAGDSLMVTCLLVDAAGEMYVPGPEIATAVTFAPADGVEETDGTVVATRAGTLEATCAADELMLVDPTPALIEVSPGDPARSVATVVPETITAGQSVTVTCEVFDAFGNAVDDATPTHRADPAAPGNDLADGMGTFERAGEYNIYCDLAGAESEAARLAVTPALPASLVISPIPESVVYGTDEVIEVARRVADRYGNAIFDAAVPVTSDPVGTVVGDGRFTFPVDGRYTLTATVSPPTDGDVVLSESLVVVVDTRGPALPCDPALDNAILDVTPGGTVAFASVVGDTSGVTELRVDGEVVPVAADGTYAVDLTTAYGLNFVRLSATDTTGQQSTGLCTFLVADTWSPDDTLLDGALSLRLRQEAFDDNNRGDPLDSIADVLDTVLNSSGLRDQIHRSLVAASPLKPSSCDQRLFGACVLRSEVIYRGLELRGPKTIRLTLVNGGAAWRVRIEDLAIRVRVRGQVSGIPYDTTGWVTFDYVEVDLTSDFALRSGRPAATVRAGSVATRVGTVTTSFSGLGGAVINIVTRLFNGTVRNLIAGVVRDYVTGNLNDVVDGLLGGVDVSALGGSVDVPRLDGGAPLPLESGFSFSNLNTTATRMLVGLGTRFTAPAAHARPTLGAPVPAGARLLDVGGTDPGGGAVHEAVVGQAVHALWLGGFFDADLDAATLGGTLPAGADLSISTVLPPVVEIVGERVRLSLGAVTVDAVGLTPMPVRLVVGVRGSMAVALVGENLEFSDFVVDELAFSTDAADLTPADVAMLEGALATLAERVIGGALGSALPVLPIPTLTLPASLTSFGLPSGAELGITAPTLSVEPPHFVLRGAFGLR